MKKLLTFVVATLFASTAFSAAPNLATITGYSLQSSYPTTSNLEHTYTGNINPNPFPGIFNYTDGTGTLADSSIQGSNEGHLFFGNTASITIFLDDYYYIDDILLYSAYNKGSSMQSAEIDGQSLTGNRFGQIVFGTEQDIKFDLTGTVLNNTALNQITLSNFDFAPSTSQTFALSEIQITGTLVSAVPEPSTYALMLGGLGLIGFMAARRRRLV